MRKTVKRGTALVLLVSALLAGPLLGAADACPVELSPEGPDCYKVTVYIDDPPPAVTVCV